MSQEQNKDIKLSLIDRPLSQQLPGIVGKAYTEKDFASFGIYELPQRHEQCSFLDLGLRSAKFREHYFVSCDFSDTDASDSVFEDCLFVDCVFNATNLAKCHFKGVCLVDCKGRNEQPPFANGSLQNAIFENSITHRTVIRNSIFTNVGIRYGIFRNVEIQNCSFEYASLEDAVFDKCNIDVMDLRNSSCRGIRIKDCELSEMHITLPKASALLGLHEVGLSNTFYVYDADDPKNPIPKEEIGEKLIELANMMLYSGNIFEATNIAYFLQTIGMLRSRNEHATSVISHDSYIYKKALEESLKVIFPKENMALPHGKESKNVNNKIMQKVESTKKLDNLNIENVSLSSLLYFVKIIYLNNVGSKKLLKIVESLVQQKKETMDIEADMPILAQIFYYTTLISQKVLSGKYRVILINPEINYFDIKSKYEFEEKVSLMLEIAGIQSTVQVGIKRGSILSVLDMLLDETIRFHALCLIAFSIINVTKQWPNRIQFIFRNATSKYNTTGVSQKIVDLLDGMVDKQNFKPQDIEEVINDVCEHVSTNPKMKDVQKYFVDKAIRASVEAKTMSNISGEWGVTGHLPGLRPTAIDQEDKISLEEACDKHPEMQDKKEK